MNRKLQAATRLPPPRLGREMLRLRNPSAILGAERTNLVILDLTPEVNKTRICVATRGETKPGGQLQ